MGRSSKSLRVIVFAFLTVVFLTSSITNSQDGAAQGYISPNVEGVHYNLTLYNPDNQTSYSKTMPLHFILEWVIDRQPTYPFTGVVSYRIDNGARINVESSQTANDQYASYQQDFKINPSFSYSVIISGLENGYHTLVITGDFYAGSSLVFDEATTPFQFLVDNSTPTPTVAPTVPELPATLAITFLVITALAVAVAIGKKHSEES
jgi:hypothetical protein